MCTKRKTRWKHFLPNCMLFWILISPPLRRLYRAWCLRLPPPLRRPCRAHCQLWLKCINWRLVATCISTIQYWDFRRRLRGFLCRPDNLSLIDTEYGHITPQRWDALFRFPLTETPHQCCAQPCVSSHVNLQVTFARTFVVAFIAWKCRSNISGLCKGQNSSCLMIYRNGVSPPTPTLPPRNPRYIALPGTK